MTATNAENHPLSSVGFVSGSEAEPPPLTELYVDAPMKCFLCDRIFLEGEQTWLIFEQRVRENGQLECTLSTVLSSALGQEVSEPITHSSTLCDACNAKVLEFELVEQRFCEIRYRIISTYNRTARRNALKTIGIEINGVLQETRDDFDILGGDEQALDIIAPDEAEQFATLEAEFVDQTSASSEAKLANNVAKLAVKIEPPELNSEDTSKYAFSVIAPQDEDAVVSGVIHEDDIITHDEDIEEELPSATAGDVEDIMASPLTQDDDNNSDDLSEFLLKTLERESNVNDDDDATQSSCPSLGAEEEQMLYEQLGDMFVCLVCNTHEQLDEQALADHMQSAHQTFIHSCHLCNLGFLRSAELNDHLNTQHCGDADVRRSGRSKGPGGVVNNNCELCNQTFSNNRQLRIHKRTHYNTVKHYECSECHKKYSSRNLLDSHMNMHTGARPFKCHKCPKDFASKYTLQTHLKIHTDRARPFQCDVCYRSFFSQHNLTQHKKRHLGTKSFVCDICSKSFGTQHNLDVHKIIHTGERPFICRTCGKSFARRAEIKDHERTHTGERPYKCDMCPLAFAQRSNLTTHKKTTHFNEKQHRCEKCGRCFKRKRLLNYHINSVHTGERPHQCDLCGATFVYPEHLKKHSLIHTGTKPFACEVCGKEFNSRDNRNFHRFVHSARKPYECMQCGNGFMRKPLLLAHMKQTGHVSDSIVINQPVISSFARAASAASSQLISMDDYTVDSPVEYDDVAPDTVGELLDQIMEEQLDVDVNDNDNADANEALEMLEDENDESIITQESTSVEGDSDDDLGVGSGQLIKNEMSDDKYLEFEDIDGDGEQTFTWVDIENTTVNES